MITVTSEIGFRPKTLTEFMLSHTTHVGSGSTSIITYS
jgi:hypothetical protein